MKIAINALSAQTGGGLIYLKNLIRELIEHEPDHSYIVFVTTKNRKEIVPEEHRCLVIIETCIRSRLMRLLYEQTILPIRLGLARADVLFAPAEIAPLLSPCPIVLGFQNITVYQQDAIRRTLLDRTRNAILFGLAWLSARRARKCIFFSRFSQSLISAALGIELDRGTVVHHGVDPIFRLEPDAELPSRDRADSGSILCVSAINTHKNLECLVDAYGRLDIRLRSRHPLVIVGAIADHRYHSGLVTSLCDIGIDPEEVFSGSVSLDSLATLYRRAAVFVFPSMLETFGLPLVEAMASGVPVIAAAASSIPEIVGDAGVLFDPLDSESLAVELERVLRDIELREQLTERGYTRAKLFTWNAAAQATLEVLGSTTRLPRRGV